MTELYENDEGDAIDESTDSYCEATDHYEEKCPTESEYVSGEEAANIENVKSFETSTKIYCGVPLWESDSSGKSVDLSLRRICALMTASRESIGSMASSTASSAPTFRFVSLDQSDSRDSCDDDQPMHRGRSWSAAKLQMQKFKKHQKKKLFRTVSLTARLCPSGMN